MSNLLEDVQYCLQAFLLICTSVFPNIPASCTFFLQIFLCSFTLIPSCALMLYIVFPHFSNLLFVFPELCALCFQTSFDLCIVFPIFLSVVLFSLQMILYFFTLFPPFASNLYRIVSTLLKSVHVVSEYFLRLYMLSSNFPRLWFSNVPRTWCILFLDLCLFFSQLYSFHLYILFISFTFICTFVSRMFF